VQKLRVKMGKSMKFARLIGRPEEFRDSTTGLNIAVPALARFETRHRELAAMLPIVDFNGDLLADAGAFAPLCAQTADVAAGILMVDPFLVAHELADCLRAAGFRAVANFPTIQVVDGQTGHSLAAVGYSFQTELRILMDLRRRGFATHVYVTGVAAAQEALACEFSDLVVYGVPGTTTDMRLQVWAEIERHTGCDGARLRLHAPD
jgi:predicted TIM-barrel enzyme